MSIFNWDLGRWRNYVLMMAHTGATGRAYVFRALGSTIVAIASVGRHKELVGISTGEVDCCGERGKRIRSRGGGGDNFRGNNIGL